MKMSEMSEISPDKLLVLFMLYKHGAMSEAEIIEESTRLVAEHGSIEAAVEAYRKELKADWRPRD